MLEKIVQKAEAWAEYWVIIVSGHGGHLPSKSRISGVEFFCANQLLSYVLSSALWIGLFSYSGVFRRHPNVDMVTGFGFLSSLFVAYFILTFMALVLSCLISYLVYLIVGGRGSFKNHMNDYFKLSALEPLAGCAVAVYWLSDGKGWGSILGVGLLVASRIWQIVRGYSLLARTHDLDMSRAALGFVLGFIPAALVFNLVMVALGWVIAATAIVPWWD